MTERGGLAKRSALLSSVRVSVDKARHPERFRDLYSREGINSMPSLQQGLPRRSVQLKRLSSTLGNSAVEHIVGAALRYARSVVYVLASTWYHSGRKYSKNRLGPIQTFLIRP